MSNEQSGVAAGEMLPGKVLSPNATTEELLQNQPTGLEQFGVELEKPAHQDAAQIPSPSADAEQKRYEYWQSQAQKIETEKKALEQKLAEKSKFDPLIDVIRTDDEALRFLQNRLSSPRTPEKPLEAPQRPPDYNEVEALSNPESSSFKHRLAMEQYRDRLLLATRAELERVQQREEQERAMQAQQQAQQESLKRFHDEVISKGIASEEFAEFFEMINKASTDDMVEFFQYKKGRATGVPDTRFRTPVGVGAPPPRKTTSTADIGGEVLGLSRRM